MQCIFTGRLVLHDVAHLRQQYNGFKSIRCPISFVKLQFHCYRTSFLGFFFVVVVLLHVKVFCSSVCVYNVNIDGHDRLLPMLLSFNKKKYHKNGILNVSSTFPIFTLQQSHIYSVFCSSFSFVGR